MMSDQIETVSSQDEREATRSCSPCSAPAAASTAWTEERLIDAIDAGRWDEARRLLRAPPPTDAPNGGGGGGGIRVDGSSAAADCGSDGENCVSDGDRRYFGPSLRCACTSRRIPPDVVSSMLRLADLDVLFPPRPHAAPFHPRATTHLHNAVAHGRDCTVSAVLTEMGPDRASDEVRRLSYGGSIPLDEAWVNHLRANISAAEATQRVRTMATVGGFEDFFLRGAGGCYHRLRGARELWNKTTALLIASEGSCPGGVGAAGPLWDGRQWRAVHAAAGCGRVGMRGTTTMAGPSSPVRGGRPSLSSASADAFSCNELQTHCPAAVVWFALKLYPDQASQRDEFGDLPLHIAASNPVHHPLDMKLRPTAERDDADGVISTALREMNRPAAEAILELRPESARCADRAGRVPLNLAVEAFDRWAAACRARSLRYAAPFGRGGGGGGGSNNAGPRWLAKDDPYCWMDVVMALAKAAPEALAARDVRTRLYPFMLAGSVRSAPLDATYLLLRANPAMVRGGIRATQQERYLEEKVRALKREREDHVAELEELRSKVFRLEGSPR